MAYFQNVMNSEWIGIYAISDRQYNKNYQIKGNKNTSLLMTNWVDEPYDTSTANLFGIKYSIDAGKTYNQISITLTSSSSITAAQIITELNANASFASMFTASLAPGNKRIVIRANNSFREYFWSYVPNLSDISTPTTSAEIVLGFNLKAPVVEMPSYFARYVIGVSDASPIVLLSQPDENFVITNAGLSTTPKKDYEFVEGTSGIFHFQNITVDISDRITQIIEYPCGAKAGDLGRKINYTYTGSNTRPSQITEIPYTIAAPDLITPP